MLFNDTLAQVGFRARRITPAAAEIVATKKDHERAAQECTSFLDQCAAEARDGRWFPANTIAHRRRSTVMERVYEVIAAHGPICVQDIAPRVGHERSATEKAVRQLKEDGKIYAVAKNKRGGYLYEVWE